MIENLNPAYHQVGFPGRTLVIQILLGTILAIGGTSASAQTASTVAQTDATSQGAAQNSALATPVTPPPTVDLAGLNYSVEEAHLFEPFWSSETIYGEPVILIKENVTDPAYGTLLFTPKAVKAVYSSNHKTNYIEGKDYTVDKNHRRILLAPESRIPTMNRVDLYKHKGDADAIPYKADDPTTYLFYHEAFFRTKQVEVDYVRDEPWTGYTPKFAGDELPKTIAKLKGGAGLNVCLLGDSIAAGANSSGDSSPYMPGFGPLTALGLMKAYGSKITFTNMAKGSTSSHYGIEKLSDTIAAQPDLVIIAFGMNDIAERQPGSFAKNIKGTIDGVRSKLPNAEFILISTSVANPEWNWSPANQFVPYRDALHALAGPGVAFADMTQLWIDMLKNKRYLDLAGNGVNHPNDFGHRLYAQVLMSLLVDTSRK